MLAKSSIIKLRGVQYKHLGRLLRIPQTPSEVAEINRQGKGLDCLGLLLIIYQSDGFIIPDYVWGIDYKQRWYRSRKNLYLEHFGSHFDRVGDLKFLDTIMFRTNSRIPNHVGIYIGGNAFIHPLEGKSVIISKLTGFWRRAQYGYFRPKEERRG